LSHTRHVCATIWQYDNNNKGKIVEEASPLLRLGRNIIMSVLNTIVKDRPLPKFCLLFNGNIARKMAEISGRNMSRM
jgi:hypothetical protein